MFGQPGLKQTPEAKSVVHMQRGVTVRALVRLAGDRGDRISKRVEIHSLDSAPETMKLQRVVAKTPGLAVPSFAAAELKTWESSAVRLVKQGQGIGLQGQGAASPQDRGQDTQM